MAAFEKGDRQGEDFLRAFRVQPKEACGEGGLGEFEESVPDRCGGVAGAQAVHESDELRKRFRVPAAMAAEENGGLFFHASGPGGALTALTVLGFSPHL